MIHPLLLGLLMLATMPTEPLPICERQAPPRFEDFAVPAERVASPKLDLNSHPIGRRFRTILRRAVREKPPNLAGHYLVVEWGCGTSCSQLAIVDLASGAIWHDERIILTRGLETRATSRLVILNPGIGYPFETQPTTDHLWSADDLTGLCQLERDGRGR